MSTVERRVAVFIQGMIDHGDIVKAYMAAYPQCKKPESARTSGYRLLQIETVKIQVDEGQRLKASIVAEQRKIALEAAARDRLLSATEVDAILCDIIAGRHLQTRKMVVYNRTNDKFEVVTVTGEPPATSEIIAAADKFYKRGGHYAAKKIDDVTNKKNTVLVPGED